MESENQTRKKCKFVNETETRKIFEKLLGVRFEKVRGVFSNKKLELDGYASDCGPEGDVKIGFEYQGAQHYKYIEYFHGSDPGKLAEQQQRDQIKRDECKDLGIFLLEVPYYAKNKEEFIRNELDEMFKTRGISNWELEGFEPDWWGEEEKMGDNNGIFTCEFCGAEFTRKSNMQTHQKTVKSCLEIQGKTLDGFTCQYCSEILTTKHILQTHESKCTSKTTYEYQLGLNSLKEEISKLTTELKAKKGGYSTHMDDIKEMYENELQEKDQEIARLKIVVSKQKKLREKQLQDLEAKHQAYVKDLEAKLEVSHEKVTLGLCKIISDLRCDLAKLAMKAFEI